MPKPAAALLLIALFATGCTEQAPLEPAAAPQLSTETPTLIECPTSVAQSASAVIGILGGTVSVDGSRITLPPGAVLEPTTITLTVPASNYMEIDITANDEEHFEFLFPAKVTISYARCTNPDLDHVPLTAWYIDGLLHTLLQHMGGFDNKLLRTVTFKTDHLSGYSIAE
jgi:hypothetical protein